MSNACGLDLIPSLADLFIRGLPHSITARYFSSNPSDSGSLRTPCPPSACAVGRRGITPAFGYSAPHPGPGGPLTLLIHALPSAHYGLIRLLIHVHARRVACRLPEPARYTSPGMDETSQVPHKELLHVHKVSDCARFFPCKPLRHGQMLPSLQQNEIGTSELDPFRSSILGPWSPL